MLFIQRPCRVKPSGKAGFFFPEVGLGERVTKGQKVGYVIDPLTDVLTPALALSESRSIKKACFDPLKPERTARR